MTRPEMSLPDKAVELITCPTCGARPGEPCRTVSGRKLTDNGHSCHSGRVDPLHEIWADGYMDREATVAAWRRRTRQAEDAYTKLRTEILTLVKASDLS